MNAYHTKFEYCLAHAGIAISQLPHDLQSLIQAYKKAYQVWEKSDTVEQKQWLLVLVDSDALICAKLYQLYKDKIQLPPTSTDSINVDKLKLLALKAKALLLK